MHALLDFIFPPRCAGCDRPGTVWCAECDHAVPRIDRHAACRRCGASAKGACTECSGRRFAFGGARCASLLRAPVSHAVVALKDGGERRYAGVLAGLLAEACDGWLSAGEALVPVPASPAAVRRRGFDHARDITRALARMTSASIATPLRSADRRDQRELGIEERFANRAGAFSVVGPGSVPSCAVLVDDVLTTGATADAAARALLSAGCRSVRVLTVARTCDVRLPCGPSR